MKEFYILAHIGCYCKIMVFSPFKLEVTYYCITTSVIHLTCPLPPHHHVTMLPYKSLVDLRTATTSLHQSFI